MITRKQLIENYINFFKSKGHKEIPNESLIPRNDPTVLFTTAGMHPLVPYLLGQKHPSGKRLVNVQKCIRTGDIDEVGDENHHTFFEMLGNWSLGDYWKEESINMSYEFLTKKLKLSENKLAVSIFSGDNKAQIDSKSAEIWAKLGVKRITPLKEANWWGPAGKTGPCGPSTEIFYWNLNKKSMPKKFNPNDSTLATGDKKGWVEIWNNVFMEYSKDEKGKYLPAKQKNVDTGMGVERTLAILNNLEDNYETEVWKPIIKVIEKLSKKKYSEYKREMRIIADHIKAAVFIIADRITPSNTEQGYVLRRLIRRAIGYGKKLGLNKFTKKLAEPIFGIYSGYKFNKKEIRNELDKEEERFVKTLPPGLKKVDKLSNKGDISGKDAFLLYQSYGLPIDMTIERAMEKGSEVDEKGFLQELKKHQSLSRTATSGKFKSGLSDNSEATTKLHTATHLLNEALRKVLGKDVRQRGSNITPERLRFDFSFNRKLTPKEIKKVETLVNKEIKKGVKITKEEMSLKKALASGAQAEFGAKYPEIVSVYTIGNFSKEICTGPHVQNTNTLGKFRITKESSSSTGVRRIKAIIE